MSNIWGHQIIPTGMSASMFIRKTIPPLNLSILISLYFDLYLAK